MSQRAEQLVRGEEAPNEPIESVKQMRRAPTARIPAIVFFMPPIVTASATSGDIAVSTESGDARFHTAVSLSAWSLKSFTTDASSRTSMPPTHTFAEFLMLEGRWSWRSLAITCEPARASACVSRLPTAPAAPMISTFDFTIARKSSQSERYELEESSCSLVRIAGRDLGSELRCKSKGSGRREQS